MVELYRRFFASLEAPLAGWIRVLLIVLVIPLGAAVVAPLWHIEMVAPQYPRGLDLDIYAYTVKGHIQEVNTLNHYIGMKRIDRAELSDLNWIPFGIGALVLLTLRVAAIGKGRDLVDLLVLFSYFSIFSAGRFVYKLYVYGHNLDPHAPFRVEPFMPPVLGTQQIANFTTTSFPGLGTALLILFALALAFVTIWHVGRWANAKLAPSQAYA